MPVQMLSWSSWKIISYHKGEGKFRHGISCALLQSLGFAGDLRGPGYPFHPHSPFLAGKTQLPLPSLPCLDLNLLDVLVSPASPCSEDVSGLCLGAPGSMETVVIVAIGVLATIFLASFAALVVVCRQRYCRPRDLLQRYDSK